MHPAHGQRKRATIIINPESGRGRGDISGSLIVLSRRFDIDGPYFSRSADDLKSLVRQSLSDVVILGGGDGTLHAALQALIPRRMELGIIPLGTANDFARSLGIPSDVGEAVKLIADGATRASPVDVASANGVYFLNASHVGLAVRAAQNRASHGLYRSGVIGYVLSALSAIQESKPFSATLELSCGKRRIRAMQVTVCNSGFYGHGLTVSSEASPRSGLLHPQYIRPVSLWRWPRMAVAMGLGKSRDDTAIESLEGETELKVITRKRRRVSADGEIVTETPVMYRIHRNALSVYTPAVSVRSDDEAKAGTVFGAAAPIPLAVAGAN